MVSWSGLDVGFDRGTTVADYDGSGRFLGPNAYTGTIHRVRIELADDQNVDQAAASDNEITRD